MTSPLLFEICDDLCYLSEKKPKKDRILFFGRDSFSDNSKYLFLHMLEEYKNMEIIWCTDNDNLFSQLQSHQLPAFHINRNINNTINFLMESAMAVFCVNPFESTSKNILFIAALQGAITVQLWHGIGVKKIDLATTPSADLTDLSKTKSIRNAASADYYLSPSSFVDDKWKDFFGTRNFIRAGYPRNEVLVRDPIAAELIGSELESVTFQALYCSDRKTILLAPTWVKDSGLNEVQILTAITHFCDKNKINVFIKHHPFVKNTNNNKSTHNHVFYIPSSADIYPHLRQFDAIVTDYSSIIFDFLLTDKPIITVGIEKGNNFDYSLIPESDTFRYSFNLNNITSIFTHALFNDNKSKYRQKVKDIIFESDNLKANENIASKIISLYEKEKKNRTKVNII
jgi:CDP-glycerol glycerophosphotransferase (TagB/SpsB family)